MAAFNFQGEISASKSMMNRALVIQSYSAGIEISGESVCDDVALMQTALQRFKQGEKRFDCGHAGTVFRFLALRLAREPGEWMLLASPRLLSRPQEGLYSILQQLGVKYHLTPVGLVLQSEGWRPAEVINVDGQESSQFLSSLFLNSWNLSWDLKVSMQGELVSSEYFNLTKKMLSDFGLKISSSSSHCWEVSSGQKPKELKYAIEPDMSSCLAVAACAVLGGQCEIRNVPLQSWQPDAIFKDVFKKIGVHWMQEASVLKVQKTHDLQPLVMDVKNSPDIVPVLSVLLALAKGNSHLTGFEHLKHKESNRLEQVQLLLQRLGRKTEIRDGEFIIYGKPDLFLASGIFNPDQDHRMAMAAQVANFGGAKFEIEDRGVVDKSFPEFWQIVGRA